MTKQAFREAQRVAPMGAAGLERMRQITREHQAAKINEVLIDGYSASAVVQVYDKLNDANREKLLAMPVAKVCSVVFKLIS